jgi:hypothetical protein
MFLSLLAAVWIPFGPHAVTGIKKTLPWSKVVFQGDSKSWATAALNPTVTAVTVFGSREAAHLAGSLKHAPMAGQSGWPMRGGVARDARIKTVAGYDAKNPRQACIRGWSDAEWHRSALI